MTAIKLARVNFSAAGAEQRIPIVVVLLTEECCIAFCSGLVLGCCDVIWMTKFYFGSGLQTNTNKIRVNEQIQMPQLSKFRRLKSSVLRLRNLWVLWARLRNICYPAPVLTNQEISELPWDVNQGLQKYMKLLRYICKVCSKFCVEISCNRY